MTVYGCTVQAPTLVVAGQADVLIELMKKITSNLNINSEDSKLIKLLANVERWNGTIVPEKVGTVKLKNLVTPKPLNEHLDWTKLFNLNNLSAGIAITAEPVLFGF